jgi:hypothetical protein
MEVSDLLDIAQPGRRHTLLLALLRQSRMRCRDELICADYVEVAGLQGVGQVNEDVTSVVTTGALQVVDEFVAKIFVPILLALATPSTYLYLQVENGGSNAALQVRLLGQGLYRGARSQDSVSSAAAAALLRR